MRLKIGEYELDPESYELSGGGVGIKLERIPLDLLLLLVERRGGIVTREEIIAHLWGKDVYLDVDNGINTAIRKLRRVFHDDPARPAYIRTVMGKGYQFIAEVEPVASKKIAPPSTTRAMLVVLPFDNLSADPEQEYFADGLTEETISHLGQMDPDRLGVIARISSIAYKRSVKSAAQIATELHVDYLLESSVRRHERRVRITSQLIRANDQTHMWAESYDRELTSLLDVQNEIGAAIARQVQLRLVPGLLDSRRERDVDAHDLYLRGRFYWNQLTTSGIRQAILFFEQAVARDPSYAAAYAGIGECYAVLPITSDAFTPDIHPKALEAANKAVELDESLAEAHAAIGAIKTWMEWDWKGAETSLERAIALNPSFLNAHRWYALVLSATGRHQQSASEMTIARRLDPLSALMHGLSGGLMYNAGEDQRAIEHLRDALAINSNLWVLHLWIGKPYERQGHFVMALQNYQMAFELSGEHGGAFLKRVYSGEDGRLFRGAAYSARAYGTFGAALCTALQYRDGACRNG